MCPGCLGCFRMVRKAGTPCEVPQKASGPDPRVASKASKWLGHGQKVATVIAVLETWHSPIQPKKSELLASLAKILILPLARNRCQIRVLDTPLRDASGPVRFPARRSCRTHLRDSEKLGSGPSSRQDFTGLRVCPNYWRVCQNYLRVLGAPRTRR